MSVETNRIAKASEHVKDLLVGKGIGVFAPPADSKDWGVFLNSDPAEPINTIAILDSLESGSSDTLGVDEEPGETAFLQIRVRATNEPLSYRKADEVQQFLHKHARFRSGVYQYTRILANKPFLLPNTERNRFIHLQNVRAFRIRVED